jgi:hypothetical protein
MGGAGTYHLRDERTFRLGGIGAFVAWEKDWSLAK